MTKSEKNTIRFFRSIGVEIDKVPEAFEKTPDYFLSLNDQLIYLEVKEIDENNDEKDILQTIYENKEIRCYESDIVGKRFRSKIAEANRQLKKLCKNNESGIVVIQDIRPFFTKSIMPQEEIKQAMFGDRIIWLTAPTHYNEYESEVTADIFSYNKTTTESKNTTTSAVALLIEDYKTSELTFLLHHNPHAKNPLSESIFSGFGIRQFRIISTKNYCDFVEVQNT